MADMTPSIPFWGNILLGRICCCCSVAKPCPTLCSPMDWSTHQASLSFTISQSFLKFMSIESVMLSNHLILCHLLLLLLSIFPNIRVFSSDLTLHTRRPKYWSFNFSISPSNEYSGLISYRIDWSDLGVPGTLKGLLQHHSSKTSILRCSVFFMVQLSHLDITTGKTITLTIQTFVAKWYLCFLIHCLGLS